MRADYHMHTEFSDDTNYPMEECVQRAIAVGLDEICITEHSDYLSFTDECVCDYEAYYKKFLSCKEKYKDQIIMKFGCEFGMQPHTAPKYQKIMKQYAFDFIILSNHQVDDLCYFDQGFQKGKTQREYNIGCYQGTYETMKKFHNFSVLGHLDIMKRYDLAGVYSDEECDEIITKILLYVIEHGKGIEVNTSNYRYQLPDLTPSRYILKRYLDLGGTILTFGSDSHNENQVGYKLEEVKEIVKGIGFKQFCTFKKMKPIYHDL